MPELTFTEEEIKQLAKEVARHILPELKELLNSKEELLSVEEACKYLKCPKTWLYDKVRQRKIPYIKVGKYLRFKKADLDKWLTTKTK